MPAGSVTLLEASKAGSDTLKAGVVETIIMESPEIELLPWMSFEGNALKHQTEGSLPDVQFRSVNETYSRSWGGDEEHFWGVAIMGGEVFIDNYLLRVSANKESLKAKQWAKLGKSNAMRFGWEFWNGTGANKGFKGMKDLVSEGWGQSLLNATGGGTVSLDKLDEAHDLFRNQGGPDALMMNRTVRRQITRAARTSVTGVSLIDVGSDAFGRQVVTWNDIPIRITGDVRDGSGNVAAALPFNEDPGDGTSDCASVWFVKFGEDDITGLLGLGGSFDVVDFGEQQSAPGHMGRLEWYPGIAIFNRFSVVRLTGVTAV